MQKQEDKKLFFVDTEGDTHTLIIRGVAILSPKEEEVSFVQDTNVDGTAGLESVLIASIDHDTYLLEYSVSNVDQEILAATVEAKKLPSKTGRVNIVYAWNDVAPQLLLHGSSMLYICISNTHVKEDEILARAHTALEDARKMR